MMIKRIHLNESPIYGHITTTDHFVVGKYLRRITFNYKEFLKMWRAYPLNLGGKVEHEGSVDGNHREAHQSRTQGAVEHDGEKLAFPITDW